MNSPSDSPDSVFPRNATSTAPATFETIVGMNDEDLVITGQTALMCWGLPMTEADVTMIEEIVIGYDDTRALQPGQREQLIAVYQKLLLPGAN